MNRTPAYERDPYLRELRTELIELGDDGRPFALLADSVLYPEGGGQPPDRGMLDGRPVVDVQTVDGQVRHYLESTEGLAAGPVRVELDWDRRFDHMQHHTGQHLLTAVADDRFGWPTTSFHLKSDLCDVELDVPALSAADLEQLEEAVAEEIRRGRPVRPRHVPVDEYERMEVRSRGLPDGHLGDVRLVAIEGVDLNTCGGTHLSSTAEIEAIHLLHTEKMRGGTRLYFVAGVRARRRARAHERRTAELRQLLGTEDARLVDAVEQRQSQLRELGRRERDLLRELTDWTAAGLAASDEPLIARHFPGRDGGFVQAIARQLESAAPARVLLLTAGEPDAHTFLLAAGPESPLDVGAIGPQVAEAFGGRGGGSGRRYQGKGRDVEALERAAAIVRAALG